MEIRSFADTLQALRKKLQMSQTGFAEFLDIPQTSVSAYENGRISPTMDVLINIAQKCNVSIDWLCGISDMPRNISSMSEVAEFLYFLKEANEIGVEIEVHDYLPNDIETETEKWYTRLTVYGNDPRYEHNSTLCQIIAKVRDHYTDLESYSITEDLYALAKRQIMEYYNGPLTKRIFPELSKEERFKKRLEYLTSGIKKED